MCLAGFCFLFKSVFWLLGIIAMGLLVYALFEVVRMLISARRITQRVDRLSDYRNWIDLIKTVLAFTRKK